VDGVVTSEPLVDALNRELRAASPDLVGNGDLLRSVLAGCGDCIKVLDLDGRLQFMSEGGKRVMEVDDFSALKGCPWPDFWPGEGNEQAAAAVNSAKAGKTARFRGPANTAKGNPRYWDVQVSPIFGPDGQPAQLLSISRDITEEWNAIQRQEENAKRERFLTEELQHRVKNTYSLVLSIARQTFRGEPHAAQLKAYGARIMALASAYDAMSGSNITNTPILTVVEAALKSHRTGQGNFSVSGPPLKVAPNQALSLTLAVNELATNAAKYGALSTPNGRVEISWSTSVKGVPTFHFNWREHSGPAVVKPTRQGFGSRVIRDFMANDFGGTVRLAYEPDGVVCELKSPLGMLPV
jgi:two-component sensor histidine kinase